MPLRPSPLTEPSPDSGGGADPGRPAVTGPDASGRDPGGPPAAGHRPGRRADLVAVVASLALSFWVTGGMWLDPTHRAITVNSSDQSLFEWLLAFGAHAVSHGENPLFTHLLNVPDGVNLAVNTSITVYAVLFAPLTYLLGAPTTFLIILTANLAATALAWYWLFSRHLLRSAPAALLGSLFIGFSPGMVSHANAHLNWTAGWLGPLILWWVLRLRDPGRWVRAGVALGVGVAVAFSIAAEGLFFIALACAVFLAAWAVQRDNRAAVRAALPIFVRGLAVAGAVTLVLLAYPLWLHFLGPQRFHGTGFDPVIHSEDIAAYGAYPARSLAGLAGLGTHLAPNPTEENSFFGVPLLVLAVACAVLLWRRAGPAHRATPHRAVPRRTTLRALLVTAGVFVVLSWGPRIKIFGTHTPVPLPFALLGHLPVVDAALPSRLALVVTPIVGLLLGYAVDALLADPPASRPRRWGWVAGFAVALVPLFPATLLTIEREPVPAFITAGVWRQYVPAGGVIAPLPFTLDVTPDGQRWQAYAFTHRQGEFAVPSGFFLGPGGPDGRGRIGPVPRPTNALLNDVAETGVVPPIGAAQRAAAREDLRYWRVDVVVLADRIHGAKWPVHHDALLRAATDLLGSPQRVADVWLWRITPTRPSPS